MISKQFQEDSIKKLLTIDIPQWQDGAHNYTSHLLSLIRKADPRHLHKLSTIYPNEVEAFKRWERIELAEALMPEVGAVMEAGKAFGDVEPGMLGVVYERYDRTNFDFDREDNIGVSILFETGFYDGFSMHDLEACSVRYTGKVDQLSSYYQFENVGQLDEDFRRGIFDRALGKKPEPEPQPAKQNIALTEDDFKTLVSGGEVVKEPMGVRGVNTHIILQDIGFDRMLARVDEAMTEI